jgi:hypothetical protein
MTGEFLGAPSSSIYVMSTKLFSWTNFLGMLLLQMLEALENYPLDGEEMAQQI